jgi:hypothetical protein
MRRLPFLLAASAVVLSLAACAGTADSNPTDPVTSDAPSSPAASTPAAAAQDPADPSTWIISAEGIGPMRLGDTGTQAIAATTAYVNVSDPAACPNPRAIFLGPAGSTVSNAPVVLATDENGKVVGIASGDAGAKTAEGIGVGSTLVAAKTAYPTGTDEKRGPTDTPNLLTVRGTPGWMSFEYDGGSATISQAQVNAGGLPPYEYCG